MKLAPLACAMALASVALARAEDAGVSLSLAPGVPPILPERVSPYVAQAGRMPLWQPPMRRDVIVPLGVTWPIPAPMLQRPMPCAVVDSFTTRVIGQVLYVRPEAAGW